MFHFHKVSMLPLLCCTANGMSNFGVFISHDFTMLLQLLFCCKQNEMPISGVPNLVHVTIIPLGFLFSGHASICC